jgi:hypothetical protein
MGAMGQRHSQTEKEPKLAVAEEKSWGPRVPGRITRGPVWSEILTSNFFGSSENLPSDQVNLNIQDPTEEILELFQVVG